MIAVFIDFQGTFYQALKLDGPPYFQGCSMSEITTIREKVKSLVSSAYGETNALSHNAMFALVADSLKKNHIEYKNGVIRCVSVPVDYQNHLKMGDGQNKDKILRELYDSLRIEIMPKVNLDKGNVTLLHTISQIQHVIKELNSSITEGIWIEHADKSDLFYQDKDILHMAYNDHMGNIGYVNLGESEMGRNHFKYPEFNGYSAPTFEFRIFDAPIPHLTEGPTIKYHFDVLNKTYETLKKIQ